MLNFKYSNFCIYVLAILYQYVNMHSTTYSFVKQNDGNSTWITVDGLSKNDMWVCVWKDTI